MLTILVKTIVNKKNTSDNTLAIADTPNTNTAVEKYCQYEYDTTYFTSAPFIFPLSFMNKVNKMIVVEKMAKSL